MLLQIFSICVFLVLRRLALIYKPFKAARNSALFE
jgi:hypothetical protein